MFSNFLWTFIFILLSLSSMVNLLIWLKVKRGPVRLGPVRVRIDFSVLNAGEVVQLPHIVTDLNNRYFGLIVHRVACQDKLYRYVTIAVPLEYLENV